MGRNPPDLEAELAFIMKFKQERSERWEEDRRNLLTKMNDAQKEAAHSRGFEERVESVKKDEKIIEKLQGEKDGEDEEWDWKIRKLEEKIQRKEEQTERANGIVSFSLRLLSEFAKNKPKRVEGEGKAQSSSISDHERELATNEAFNTQRQPLEEDEIRLIRLVNQAGNMEQNNPLRLESEIFKRDKAPAYTAVSYTWDNPNATISGKGGDIELLERGEYTHFFCLPNLLSYLRHIQSTNSEKGTYLWIDAICHKQVPSPEQKVQLRLMGETFRAAKSVHIWLGNVATPQDEENLADLGDVLQLRNDIKCGRTKKPRSFSNDPLWWTSGARAGFKYLCYNNYWTRGWIVQEVLAAKELHLLHGRKFRCTWDDLNNLERPFLQDAYDLVKLHSSAKDHVYSDNTVRYDKKRATCYLPEGASVPLDLVSRRSMVWGPALDIFHIKAELGSRKLPIYNALYMYRHQHFYKNADHYWSMLDVLEEKVLGVDGEELDPSLPLEHLFNRILTSAKQQLQNKYDAFPEIENKLPPPYFMGSVEKVFTSALRRTITGLKFFPDRLRASLAKEEHSGCVYAIAFTSSYLVTVSRDKSVRVWDLATQRLAYAPLTGHTMSVLCVAVHPTLDILFTGGADGNLIFWQLSTGKQRRISNLGLENILDLSCTSLYLAASTKKNVAVVYEITLTMRDTHIIPKVRLTHKAAVNAVLVHPGNQFVVTASGDGEIKFWDVKGWACVRSMTGHSRGIACLALSHSGKHLISGSADNTCRIWDLASGGQIACLVSHSNLVRSVCVGRDANGNDIIISGSYDGFVMVWSQVKTPEGIDVWYVREKFDVREMLKWRNPAHVVEGRDNRVFRVCWDKVKKEVVVATQRGHVAAWNL